MARPKKQPHEKRSALVQARLTAAEKIYVEEQAEAAGLSTAAYVRRRILGLPVRAKASRVDASLLTELNRIGVNINQLARAANTGRELPGTWDALAEELRDILETVALSYEGDL